MPSVFGKSIMRRYPRYNEFGILSFESLDLNILTYYVNFLIRLVGQIDDKLLLTNFKKMISQIGMEVECLNDR